MLKRSEIYLKVIFMGNSEFSVPSLDMLINEGHEVLVVVTQPDRPKRRGKSYAVLQLKNMPRNKTYMYYSRGSKD